MTTEIAKTKSTVLEAHDWPTDQAAHVWGPWMAQSGPPRSPFTQYRTCVHPDCAEFETRLAPRS